MVTFGTELASLYKKISIERDGRADAAADRSAGVAAIAAEAQELLRQASANRAAFAMNARQDAEALRAKLTEQTEQLRTEVSNFRADARAAAGVRSDARQAVANDLNKRLAAYSKSLSDETTAFMVDARKARTDSFSDLSARLSDVVRATQQSVSELRSSVFAELNTARGFAHADTAHPTSTEQSVVVKPASDPKPEQDAEKVSTSDTLKPTAEKKAASDSTPQAKTTGNASGNAKSTQSDTNSSREAIKNESASKTGVRPNKSS